VMDVMRVMAPATFSSGMLYINVYTDMFFASFIENAAAAMRYANFVVLTPLGIISNMILVPFLPVFSRLTALEDRPELKQRIRQGIFLSALTMLPFTAIFLALALPIVRVIYERGAFNYAASQEVVPVMMAYGFGMFFYLCRDVLVRVFYALGDGTTPFRVSIFNIILNFALDALLYRPFGTPGIVLATVGVNVISMVIFIVLLHRRLDRLPLGAWTRDLLLLIGITAIATVASWGISQAWEKAVGSDNLLLQMGQLSVGGLTVMVVFFGLAMLLRLPELKILSDRILKKLKR
jgi:putative peptidoglycan lipid II flippase